MARSIVLILCLVKYVASMVGKQGDVLFASFASPLPMQRQPLY